MQFTDKNGKVIKEGMVLAHDMGDEILVIKGDEGELGFNADNLEFVHFEAGEFYPLHQFFLEEWEVKEGC